jgi:hypothetical protein
VPRSCSLSDLAMSSPFALFMGDCMAAADGDGGGLLHVQAVVVSSGRSVPHDAAAALDASGVKRALGLALASNRSCGSGGIAHAGSAELSVAC